MTGSSKGQLEAIAIETLAYLGMSQHSERFVRLLKQAGIQSVDQANGLTQDQCARLHLPYDLISAMQKRIAVWKLEMQDTCEAELERGEEHWSDSKCQNRRDRLELEKAKPSMDSLPAEPSSARSRPASPRFQSAGPAIESQTPPYQSAMAFVGGAQTPPLQSGHQGGPQLQYWQQAAAGIDETRFNMLQDMLVQGLRKVDDHVSQVGQTMQMKVDHLQEHILARHAKPEQEMSERMCRIDERVGSLAQTLQAKLDGFQEQFARQRSKPEAEMCERVRKLEDRINSVAQGLQANIDGLHDQLLRNQLKPEEFKCEVSRLMQGWLDKVQHAVQQQSITEATRAQKMEGLLQLVTKRSESVAEGVDRTVQAKVDQLQDLIKRVQMSTERCESGLTSQGSVDRALMQRMEKMEEHIRQVADRFELTAQAMQTSRTHEYYGNGLKKSYDSPGFDIIGGGKDHHHLLHSAGINGGINTGFNGAINGRTTSGVSNKWTADVHNGGSDHGMSGATGGTPKRDDALGLGGCGGAAGACGGFRLDSHRGSRPQSAARNGGSRSLWHDGPSGGIHNTSRDNDAAPLPSLRGSETRNNAEGHNKTDDPSKRYGMQGDLL